MDEFFRDISKDIYPDIDDNTIGEYFPIVSNEKLETMSLKTNYDNNSYKVFISYLLN